MRNINIFPGRNVFDLDLILKERKTRELTVVVIYIYIYIYIYIVIHRQTVSLYHNSSVLLNMREGSSWDRNPAGFTSVRYLTPKLWYLSA